MHFLIAAFVELPFAERGFVSSLLFLIATESPIKLPTYLPLS